MKKLFNKENRHKLICLLPIIISIIFCSLVVIFYGKPILHFLKDTEALEAVLNEHAIVGRLGFIVIRVLQTTIKLVPGEAVELAAGYAFGTWEGLLLCMIGSVIGSAIILLFVKIFGIKAVEVFVPISKIQELKFLQNNKRLNIILLIFFFIPGTPKDSIVYLVGLTKVNPWSFLLISNLARIPSIITSTICGSALGERQFLFAAVIYIATVLLGAAGALIYRKICKKEEAEKLNEENAA